MAQAVAAAALQLGQVTDNETLQAFVRKPVLQTDCAERAVSEVAIGFLTALQRVL